MCGQIKHDSTKLELRRDDLESLGYMLIYFMRGTLPWDVPQGEATKQQFSKNIHYVKKTISTESLCYDCPLEFKESMIAYFDHVRNLKFSEEPDYWVLKTLFSDLRDKDYVDDGNLFRTCCCKEVSVEKGRLHCTYP